MQKRGWIYSSIKYVIGKFITLIRIIMFKNKSYIQMEILELISQVFFVLF